MTLYTFIITMCYWALIYLIIAIFHPDIINDDITSIVVLMVSYTMGIHTTSEEVKKYD